ncbi:hypothetical protein CG747_42500 [Streptomyces sp. CB02959]|nr:hypothetical protein CG747_42500 [Streptomyces sp. CB02959]
MSGRHAREKPSRPGLAVALLGALGLMPPALLIGGAARADSAPVPVSRADAAFQTSSAVQQGSAVVRSVPGWAHE